MKTICALLVALTCSAASAKEPPDAPMLTQQAVETALATFFSTDKNADHLIHRSIFTPGSRRNVGKKKVPVISRDEIEKGKEVPLVRISAVTIRETDSVPAQLTVVVNLVTWIEKGQSGLIPMHAFPTYEMTLDREGNLQVTKETFVIE